MDPPPAAPTTTPATAPATATASPPPPPRRALLAVVRPLLLAGWTIGAVRLALDAVAPGAAMWFGLYYALPVVLLVLGLHGAFDDVTFGRLLLAMLVTALLVWAPVNTFAYGVAQFAGWTHGRFAEGRAPPLAATPLGKLGSALLVGALTAGAASLWMLAAGTVLVAAPRWLRRRPPARR